MRERTEAACLRRLDAVTTKLLPSADGRAEGLREERTGLALELVSVWGWSFRRAASRAGLSHSWLSRRADGRRSES